MPPNVDGAQDLSSRFALLMQPVTALSEVWNIDVAAELEEYLTDIAKVSIVVDDGVTKLNFAEAALLIQGSANVYSRKVEMLYNLVYQTLEAVSEKGKSKPKSDEAKEEGDGGDADKIGDDDDFQDDFALLDNLEGESSVELLDEDKQSLTKPLPLTPATLIPSSAGASDGTRGSELFSTRGEMIGKRDDFKINSCTIHSSGFLLLDNSDMKSVERLLRQSLIKDGVPAAVESTATNIAAGSTESEIDPPIDQEWGGFDADPLPNDGAMQIDAKETSSTLPEGADAQQQDLQLVSNAMEIKASDDDHESVGGDSANGDMYASVSNRGDDGDDDDDTNGLVKKDLPLDQLIPRLLMGNPVEWQPWKMMDPHHVDERRVEKPFLKGKTFRVPKIRQVQLPGVEANKENVEESVEPSLKKKKDASGEANQVNEAALLEPVQSFLLRTKRIQEKKRDLPKSSLSPSWPEFSYLFWTEWERKKQLQSERCAKKVPAKERWEGLTASIARLSFQTEEEEEGGFVALPAADHDDNDSTGGETAPVDALIFDEPGGFGGEDLEIDEDRTNGNDAPMTYEELCRQRIEKYLQMAQQYEAEVETSLSKRVKDWETKLQSVLEDQGSRPFLDVNLYGKSVIHRFEESNMEEKSVMKFAQVAQGVQPWEACRLFLASLHLANAGNVDIIKGTSGEMSLKLMSKEVRSLEF